MTTSTQASYLKHSPSARPRTTSQLKPGLPAMQVNGGWCTWQTLVYAGNSKGSRPLRKPEVAYARVDAPHAAVPTPWLLAQWSEVVGWHRRLEDLPSSHPTVSASAVPTASSSQMQLSNTAARQAHSAAHVFPSEAPDGQQRLSKLLAEAAHDIRSPIAVAQQILASIAARVPCENGFSGEVSELLQQAGLRLAQANRWAEGILVDQVLELGHPVNIRKRFYPHQWRQVIEPLLRSLAEQRQVKLHWVGWDRSLPPLYLDSDQLSRVVLNLVNNAIQASQPGQSVRMEVNWQTGVTQRLVMTIDDNGSGLCAALMRQINATTMWPKYADGEQQAGIGLKTAKALTLGMGGSISVQKQHLAGTRFRLSFPVDNFYSLVRGWLLQNATLADQRAGNTDRRISLHAVRATSSNSSSEARFWNDVDARLQQSAGGQDLVYRVAHNRWLWLSMQDAHAPLTTDASHLQRAVHRLSQRGGNDGSSLAFREQQVLQLARVSLRKWEASRTSPTALPQVTQVLADKMSQWVGTNLLPIDELESRANAIVVRPHSGSPARQVRLDRPQTPRASHRASRNEPTPSLAHSPCDTFSGTLAELTLQWHVRQQQLEQAHGKLRQSDATLPRESTRSLP